MRTGALFAAVFAMALTFVAPAGADHPAGLPSGPSNVLAPPAPVPPPSITGAMRVGQVLTGQGGGWQGDPSLTYDWLRCDSRGSNCVFTHDTDLSHSLTRAEVGRAIRLRVVATGVGGSRVVDSAPTGVIAASPPASPSPPPPTGRPVNLLAPFVKGRLREGEIILTLPGLWAGIGPLAYANRWERCDTRLCRPTGEERFLYLLKPADVGRRMRSVVTATNTDGSGTALSDQSTIVQPARERMRPFPVIAIKGFITRRGVVLNRLAVRASPGASLRLTCRGRGCPYGGLEKRFRSSTLLVRSMRGRTLAPSALISLRVTRKGRIGKYTRFRVRRGRKPARLDLCLVPGERRPSRCPSPR